MSRLSLIGPNSWKFIRPQCCWAALAGLGLAASGCGESFSKAGDSGGELSGGAGGSSASGGSGGSGGSGVDGGCVGEACDCPAGSYWGSSAGKTCMECPANTYNTEVNSLECTPWSCLSWAQTKPGSTTTDALCGGSTIRQFGTTANDYARGAAVDLEGALYLVGETWGALDGPSPVGGENKHLGGADAFIRKYNAAGVLVWTLQFGTPENDTAHAVAIDSQGNIIVSGTTGGTLGAQSFGESDAFLRKYSPNGQVLFTEQSGGPGWDVARALHVGVDDSIWVGATTRKPEDGVELSHSDGVVRKYSADGSVIFSNMIGTENDDKIIDITLDTNGNIYVLGDTTGSFTQQTVSEPSVFIMKLSPDGASGWTKQISGTGAVYSKSIIVDGKGGVYVTGDTFGDLVSMVFGSADGFLAKLSAATGEQQWVKQFGDNETEIVGGLGMTPSGQIIVSLAALSAAEPASSELKWRVFRDDGDLVKEEGLVFNGEVYIIRTLAPVGDYFYLAGHTNTALAGQAFGGADAFAIQVEYP